RYTPGLRSAADPSGAAAPMWSRAPPPAGPRAPGRVENASAAAVVIGEQCHRARPAGEVQRGVEVARSTRHELRRAKAEDARIAVDRLHLQRIPSLVCAACGAPMSMNGGSNGRYYRCQTNRSCLLSR